LGQFYASALAVAGKHVTSLTANSLATLMKRTNEQILTFWPRNSFFSDRIVVPLAAAVPLPAAASLPGFF